MRAGGGLVVLGEEEHDKYANNLNALLGRFGIAIANDAISDYEHCDAAPHWVLADLAAAARATASTCSPACTAPASTAPAGWSSRTARSRSRAARRRRRRPARRCSRPPSTARDASSSRPTPTSSATTASRATTTRTCGATSSCGPPAAPSAGRRAQPASPAAADPHWPRAARRRRAHPRLPARRRLGRPRRARPRRARARRRAGDRRRPRPGGALPAPARLPRGARRRPRRLGAGGFERPDFGASLDAFHPELQREDGIEHLAVFPMYKQNGSRDKVLEALDRPRAVAGVARAARSRALREPEVRAGRGSSARRPATTASARRSSRRRSRSRARRRTTSARSSATARRSASAARSPPPRACSRSSCRPTRPRSSPPRTLSEQTFALWDLIHDRAHSHGDLPFDPFMIRRRMPYWMYSLEELRCDLSAFASSVALEREGFGFARNVQYAILLDRMLRFPITGERVRNYDGLAGQLLFAHLHRAGHVHWTDNRLTIDWATVGDGVEALRQSIAGLYREGIDRTQLAALERRPRPRRGVRRRRRRARRGRPSAARSPTATSRARGSTRCATTSSRCRSSFSRCAPRWPTCSRRARAWPPDRGIAPGFCPTA